MREYLVHRVDDRAIDWFVLEHDDYVALPPDTDGILKSRVFPGLWLDPVALLAEDIAALRAAVERGCATPEQIEFAARLAP
ncbi:MAG: hypothetical protein KDE27_24120 [Planctomycetes bacterium]|nr:hypothetical protein [Planctomycetota bacterium]